MTDQIKRKLKRLEEAKAIEQGITDKYSTNYPEWVKACDKVNKIKGEVNKLISEYNFDMGRGYNTIMV